VPRTGSPISPATQAIYTKTDGGAWDEYHLVARKAALSPELWGRAHFLPLALEAVELSSSWLNQQA
jgi:hypothetical protein